MAPTGGTSGRKNLDVSGQFSFWVRQNRELGEGFDSSTLFKLPNGAMRSPDATWVRRERWDALTRKQQDGYPPLCPDFVVELKTPTDNMEQLRAKMREYMDNGLILGWLIDPFERVVEIYRQKRLVEVLRSPTHLSGEDVLPAFILDLSSIF